MEILARLEDEHLDGDGRPKIAVRGKRRRSGDMQLTLFSPPEHPLVDEIRQADLDQLTPLAALEMIHAWQKVLGVKFQIKRAAHAVSALP